MNGKAGLLLVPFPHQQESPASWLTRAALSQGSTVKEFLSILEINATVDIDMWVSTVDLDRVRELTGLRAHDFWLAQRLFGGLKELELPSDDFLLFGRYRRPRYRYCPKCLASNRLAYFPVHWRFAGFKYCMLHHCMLEEVCPKCEAPVLLPVNQLTAGPKKQGVAYLKHCMSCDADLSCVEPVSTAMMSSLLSPWEQTFLRNGIATLSALYRRKVVLRETEEEKSFSYLRSLYKKRVLPNDPRQLTPNVMLGRWGARMAIRQDLKNKEHGARDTDD